MHVQTTKNSLPWRSTFMYIILFAALATIEESFPKHCRLPSPPRFCYPVLPAFYLGVPVWSMSERVEWRCSGCILLSSPLLGNLCLSHWGVPWGQWGDPTRARAVLVGYRESHCVSGPGMCEFSWCLYNVHVDMCALVKYIHYTCEVSYCFLVIHPLF